MTGTRWGRAGIAALTAAAAVLAAGVVVPGTAVAGVGTSRARAVPAIPFDLNGDGYAELVVGVANEAIGRTYQAGAVNILDGAANGVTATGNRMIHQGTPGVAGNNEPRDRFGSAVASADFDRDGFADLAIGSVGENRRDFAVPSGAVTVLYGSAHGPKGLGDQFLRPQDLRLPDGWGDALETGDLNGDGYADLVVAGAGPHDETVSHGAATVLYGSARGLRLKDAVHLTDATAGAPGPASRTDSFARSTAIGDVTGDGIDDLVVATRRDGWTGGLYLYRGRHARLSATASQFISQDSPELATQGVDYSDEGLGSGLAVGDFDGDGHADVAAGDPEAGPPGFSGCYDFDTCPGAVLVLSGSDSGMDTTRQQVWFQDSPGVPGTAEAVDHFGGVLAAGDLDSDGRDDLAVAGDQTGVAVGAELGIPSVDVLYGTASGLSGAGSQEWNQDTPGVVGVAARLDAFGTGLRIAQMGRSRTPDLVVADVNKDFGTTPDTGAVSVLYGAVGTGLVATGSQQWSQGSRGVAGVPEYFDRFGQLGG